MIERYPDMFELALTVDDIERISGQGKIASLIGVEGGHSIENSIAVLRQLYATGCAVHDAHPFRHARLGRLGHRRRNATAG